jgi:hypothetical protein
VPAVEVADVVPVKSLPEAGAASAAAGRAGPAQTEVVSTYAGWRLPTLRASVRWPPR